MEKLSYEFKFSICIIDLSVSNICIDDRIFEAGCDDVLICYIDNNIYLEFIRVAQSLDLAIESALNAIKVAGCQAMRIQVKNKSDTVKLY